eukprot:sb/3466339/
MATRRIFLEISKHGPPASVISVRSSQVADKPITGSSVLLQFLASAINPSDYNQVEGKYPVPMELPGIGGNEGSARVIEVGDNVTSLKVGDTVIPSIAGFGTWTTHKVVDERAVKKLPSGLSVAASAMFAVNPCTAYRMLRDFKTLKPGDWVIQNGATSGVGRAVIQMCRAESVNTVNIIRDRDNADQVKGELKSIGAGAVFTVSERQELETFCKTNTPQLALNMVGGRETISLLKCLGHNSNLVTYGAMSNSPMSVPFGLMVFKDITLNNYWMTRWTKEYAGTVAEGEMFERIGDWFKSGVLTPTPHEERSFFEYEDAFKSAFKRKQLFVGERTLSDPRIDELD